MKKYFVKWESYNGKLYNTLVTFPDDSKYIEKFVAEYEVKRDNKGYLSEVISVEEIDNELNIEE